MGWNIELPDAEWYQPGDESLDGLVREVLDQEVVAIDTETTGLKVWMDRPLFWSMAWGTQKRVCMPVSTLPYFKESFADAGKRWVFANAKYDMHLLANAHLCPELAPVLDDQGIRFAGECIDTQVMHALLHEEESHALKDMAKHILGWKWSDFFDTFRPLMVPDNKKDPKRLKSGGFSQPNRRETIEEMLMRCYHTDLPKLVDYASNDAYGALRIYDKLKEDLRKTVIYSLYPDWLPNMEHLFFKTEAPFTKVLWQCERNGVYVNRGYLQDKRGPMWDTHLDLRRRMVQLSGDPNFNPGSVEQKRDYFIKHLGLKPLMLTKGGKSGIKQPSIDKGFLEHYEHESEMASLVLQDSKITKLIGTYIDGADTHFDLNSRIHTRFNQDVARTGRLSSSDPNLQNIPTPEKDKFHLRGAFQATPGSGNVLIVGDYSQLEMRLLACATVTDQNPKGAEEMIQIFLDGKDIHMGNAAMVYGPIVKREHGWDFTYDFFKEAKKIDGKVKNGELPPEARTPQVMLALEKRNHIKSVGFGLNYGMKENKLARQLGISKDEALAIIKAYLATYPAVEGFYETAIEETRSSGFSFTLLGRRRFHPAINSHNAMDRWSEERKAVNCQIQGTAADAVRLAMLRISQARLDLKYGCHMLLQIHDELMFECPGETAQQAKAEIQALMEHPFPTDLVVPLDVSIGIGNAWNQAK
jgi:DNA polymerase I-like protein with 3'-5' exonuclease and polymerase domains